MKGLSNFKSACLLLGLGLTVGCTALEQSRSIDELMRIGKCKDKDTCQRLIQSAKNTIAAIKTPTTAEHFSDLAIAHTTLDHRKAALEAFEKIVELNLRDDPTLYEKVKYAFMSEHWVHETAYAAGWEYIARRSYAKAISSFESINKSAFHSAGLDIGYAMALCENAQCAEAVRVLEVAIQNSPEYYAAHLRRTTNIRSRLEYRNNIEQQSDNPRLAKNVPTPPSNHLSYGATGNKAEKLSSESAYLELVGACENLTDYLKGQNNLKDLPGVYKKEAINASTLPATGTYLQVTALAKGYFLIVEGVGSSPSQQPVNGKISFAGFVPLGPERDGITPYLGILKHDQPYFGLDPEVHPLEYYAKYFRRPVPSEYYAEMHTCRFALLLKGDGFFGYSELGIPVSQQKQWQRMQQTIPPGMGKVELNGSTAQLKDIWHDKQATGYVRLFKNQDFRKLLSFLEGQPIWGVRPEEDPVRPVTKRYEQGLNHLKNKAFNSALSEFDEGLRLMPGSALGYLLRGQAYLSLGQHDRGAGDLATALTLDREISKSQLAFLARQGLLTRGLVQAKTGRNDEAFLSYWEATKFLPDDGMAELALIELSARTQAGRGNYRAQMACDHLKVLQEEYSSCHDFLSKGWFPNRDWTEPRSLTGETLAAVVATTLAIVGTAAIFSSMGSGESSNNVPLASDPPISVPKKHWLDIAKCVDTSPGALAMGCF
ncbi:MAG: hypothetical protein GDA68_08665 [Nitrospira sp. CR2.1]|nr:hypothetical protein [Nitrospira sp. CR2.1]